MASSAADTLPRFVGEFGYSVDQDDDDDPDVANAESVDNGPLTSQDGRNLHQLPVSMARRSIQRDRQSQSADAGRGRRAAVTQYLGKHPVVCVVEEEKTTDDDPEDDDTVGGSSTGTTNAVVDDGVAHYVVDFAQSPRMRYPRTSLLGKPLGYRPSRRDTRLKRLQNRVYIFLERPKTCPSITYHTSV